MPSENTISRHEAINRFLENHRIRLINQARFKFKLDHEEAVELFHDMVCEIYDSSFDPLNEGAFDYVWLLLKRRFRQNIGLLRGKKQHVFEEDATPVEPISLSVATEDGRTSSLYTDQQHEWLERKIAKLSKRTRWVFEQRCQRKSYEQMAQEDPWHRIPASLREIYSKQVRAWKKADLTHLQGAE